MNDKFLFENNANERIITTQRHGNMLKLVNFFIVEKMNETDRKLV